MDSKKILLIKNHLIIKDSLQKHMKAEEEAAKKRKTYTTTNYGYGYHNYSSYASSDYCHCNFYEWSDLFRKPREFDSLASFETFLKNSNINYTKEDVQYCKDAYFFHAICKKEKGKDKSDLIIRKNLSNLCRAFYGETERGETYTDDICNCRFFTDLQFKEEITLKSFTVLKKYLELHDMVLPYTTEARFSKAYTLFAVKSPNSSNILMASSLDDLKKEYDAELSLLPF